MLHLAAWPSPPCRAVYSHAGSPSSSLTLYSICLCSATLHSRSLQLMCWIERRQNATASSRNSWKHPEWCIGSPSQVCLFLPLAFFSIYPPFYQGAHSAVLSWFTLIVVIILHIFCVVEKSCKERSLWSYIYFIFHLMILIWILIALIVGYSWSNGQPAADG